MPPMMQHAVLIEVALGLPAGVVLGMAYFAVLRSTLSLYLNGRFARATAMQFARVAAAAAAFMLLWKVGPYCLMSGLLGFLVARRQIVRRAGTRS